MDFDKLDELEKEIQQKKAEQEDKEENENQEQEQSEIVENEIVEQSCKERQISVPETTNKYEIQTQDNQLVNEIMKNDTALSIAKQKFADIKNQKQIANKMGKVVNKKTNADIETADIKVDEQILANKVEKARQKNELLKCNEERKFLKKESKHRLNMQKFEHRKEKYGDLLLRHCRKKIKNAEGKWEYQQDKDGNWIINMPSGFVLFWLIVFDSIVMFLNQTADVFGGLNKVVFRVFWIVVVCLFLFVPPLRQWLFGLIGLNIG